MQTRTTVLLAAFGFRIPALAALAALLLLGLSAPARGEALMTSYAPLTTSNASIARARDGQLFAPGSFWNKRLPTTVALDPSSPVLVRSLAAEAAREQVTGIGPWISAGRHSTPIYRVGRHQRRVRVRLDNGGEPFRRSLQRAFASVPIPSHASAAPLPDGHMAVWQPATDKLWEFFAARRTSDGWHARWGGAMRHVSRSRGYYTPKAWPGAKSAWGATASSLPVMGGVMLLDELRSGRIGHALAINVPAARAGVFAWPAQRTDGRGPAAALPEGARLRLDPTLDVAALKLPRLTRMIARAAQRYGLVVRDQTGQGIAFLAENPSQYGGQPYRRYFRGRTPQELLAKFPWRRLQVLRMHLCTRPPCRQR